MSDTITNLVQKLRGPLGQYFVSLDTTPVAIGARVYNSAAISIPNSAFTALTFDSERYDTDGLHDTSTNTSRLTCTRGGIYLITAHVVFAANTAGVRYVNIRLNGTTDIASHGGSASNAFETAYSVSTIYQLAVGDYVEVRVFQSSGGALNVNSSGNTSPELAMHRLA